MFIYLFLNYRCKIKKKLIIALALLKLDWVSAEFVIGIQTGLRLRLLKIK